MAPFTTYVPPTTRDRRGLEPREEVIRLDILKRGAIPAEDLVGRSVQRAVGAGAASESGRMTVAFARYSLAFGRMRPHRHAEETVYVIATSGVSFHYGEGPDSLTERILLEPAMVIHIPAAAWHVFECEPEGFADTVVMYGQVDDIRPEDSPPATNS